MPIMPIMPIIMTQSAEAEAKSLPLPQLASATPKVDRHPSLTDRELYEMIAEAKTKAHGRRGDRRMNQTLVLCLENPGLPHLDALPQSGFDFSHLTHEELEMKSSRFVKDADGITLKQRFDQLSRRIRKAKNWIEVERNEGGLLDDHDVEPCNIDDEVKSRNEAGILGGTDNDGTTVSCRRDSFDEAIEELPGIRELSSDGIDVADIFSDDDE